MAFPGFPHKSVGSEWGEKRDRASPVCLGTDRHLCVCGRDWYVAVCMCLLCACACVNTLWGCGVRI